MNLMITVLNLSGPTLEECTRSDKLKRALYFKFIFALPSALHDTAGRSGGNLNFPFGDLGPEVPKFF